MSTVSFYTLGCKLNQAETAMLAEEFMRHGYEVVNFSEPADVCVVNTCTVTGKTDYQCRQALRRAVKNAPDGVVVAVGCYSQLQAEQIADISGVDIVLGSNNKFDILKSIDKLQSTSIPIRKHSKRELFSAPNPGRYIGRTRAFLKIQDGCDAFCTYCAVPLARGRSKSAAVENVLARAKSLVQRGYKEIVLTGVHVGQYGAGGKESTNLLGLLQLLEQVDGLERIRISSLEPLEISDDLLQAIAESTKICHHLHIPLQSGDDEILLAMGRKYNTSEFRDVLKRVRVFLPNAGIGTDVIVGFPGETTQQFQRTFELIAKGSFNYLHVFKYSKRPGTEAAKLTDDVSSAEKDQRSLQLRQLGQLKKNEFYKSQIGCKHRVLFEKQKNGFVAGWSDNYLRVGVTKIYQLENKLRMVKILDTKENLAIGKLLYDS